MTTPYRFFIHDGIEMWRCTTCGRVSPSMYMHSCDKGGPPRGGLMVDVSQFPSDAVVASYRTAWPDERSKVPEDHQQERVTPPLGAPADFHERWASFQSWMNSVRAQWATGYDSGTYDAQVHEHFFALLNHPKTAEQALTIRHGIRLLQNNAVPSKDAGFIFFVLFVSGAIWGNRGVIPKTRDEDMGLGKGTVFNPEDLQ